MKKSSQIKKMPIISILEGEKIGDAWALIVNPKEGSVDFVTIEQEEGQKGIRAIPFEKVIGIGGYAITIESVDSIIDANDSLIEGGLAGKKIAAIDTTVITRKGDFLGKVLGYDINEDTGEIIGLTIKQEESEAAILSEYIMTYGKDIIIVKEAALDDGKTALKTNAEDVRVPIKQNENELLEDPLELPAANEEELRLQALKEKQIELLLNKKVVKDFYTDEGALLFAEGKVLSLEDIRFVQAMGPSAVIELSMSVKA